MSDDFDEEEDEEGQELEYHTPRPGWEPLEHKHLPRPTYFPSGVAMGVAFIFWGLITSWVIFAVGITLFIAALAGWISEIRHERKHHASSKSLPPVDAV
jgi:hypothetical protein